MQDQILDWAVVALPTLLSLCGVRVTLEPLDKKHKTKWRVALLISGLVVSGLTYRQQERQRARANAESHEFLEQVIEQERIGTAQFNALTDKFNAFVARHARQERPILTPQSPTAEEIAAEVSKQLRGSKRARRLVGHSLTRKKPPFSTWPQRVAAGVFTPSSWWQSTPGCVPVRFAV
jgi:hypothetical protein